MFDIAWGEFILIAVVALIVIGPKELPAVLRTIGQWTVKIRRMAAEFQGQFQEALREAEMADLRKEVDNLNEQAKNFTSFDPVSFQGVAKEEPKPEDAAGQPAEVAKPADAVPELAQAGAIGPPSGADHGDGAAAAPSPIEPPTASEPPAAPQGAVPFPSPEGGDGKSGEGGVRP
jgi:sec-independent protein translocase protein TatB